MIRVNPVQFNTNSRKYISFGEGNMNNITPSVAILALQNPNAKINFEKQEQSAFACAVTAFVNKIGRAVSEFKRSNNNNMQNINPDIYNHISYTA